MSNDPFVAPPPDAGVRRAIELGQYKQVGGPGLAAAVLICISLPVSAVAAWTTWHIVDVVDAFAAGDQDVSREDIDDAERLVSSFSWATTIAVVAAGVAFMVWLWRARQNAEILSTQPHRKSPGWVVAGWLVPVVNLWYPYQVVSDIHRTSAPRSNDGLHYGPEGSGQLAGWWAFWVTSFVLGRISGYIWRYGETVDALRASAILDTIAVVCDVGAAVLVIKIMRRITGWQLQAAS